MSQAHRARISLRLATVLLTMDRRCQLFLIWCHLMLARQTAILVHENVPQFWESLLHLHLGHAYWIFSMVTDCSDIGFHLISRKRRYTIMYHRAKCCIRCHPQAMYHSLAASMQSVCQPWQSQIWHCFLATANEVAE